jgi:bleomycin hydrolase
MQLEKRDTSDDNDYVHVQHLEKSCDTDTEQMTDLKTRLPKGLSISDAQKWQVSLLKDPKNRLLSPSRLASSLFPISNSIGRLAISTFTKASPLSTLLSLSTQISQPHVFNVQIPLEGSPITHQRSSGRCWLFASTNVFRVALMQKHRLAEFELSQAYLFFWDKLEKANWFLEQILGTADAALDDRLVQHVLREPLSDGGQWDMVYNLVDKYGLVPQALYPDSWNARESRTINTMIFSKLREDALVLRRMVNQDGATAEAVNREKERMVREIHTILTLTLGPPPAADEDFEWTYWDRDHVSRTVKTSPLEFARDISPSAPLFTPSVQISRASIASMLSLVHDPRHEELSLLSVDRLGNIVGGRGVRYINVSMAALKTACIKQLQAGIPVFFGCDVGKASDRVTGVMDLELYDYEVGFGVSVNKGRGPEKKADRLRSGESSMTHAMVLTAVHVVDGKSVRWRVQNSWGPEPGEKGWFVMSDGWMDEFCYQAVVDPRFVGQEVRDVLKKEPVVLPLWDPMGSLA